MNEKISHERIRARAYERYLARGGRDGSDVEDWLAAEADLARGQRPTDVVLVDPGRNVIEVIRRIREVTGLGINEVKEMIDARPRVIKRLELSEAETVQAALKKLGARVELKTAS